MAMNELSGGKYAVPTQSSSTRMKKSASTSSKRKSLSEMRFVIVKYWTIDVTATVYIVRGHENSWFCSMLIDVSMWHSDLKNICVTDVELCDGFAILQYIKD